MFFYANDNKKKRFYLVLTVYAAQHSENALHTAPGYFPASEDFKYVGHNCFLIFLFEAFLRKV